MGRIQKRQKRVKTSRGDRSGEGFRERLLTIAVLLPVIKQTGTGTGMGTLFFFMGTGRRLSSAGRSLGHCLPLLVSGQRCC